MKATGLTFERSRQMAAILAACFALFASSCYASDKDSKVGDEGDKSAETRQRPGEKKKEAIRVSIKDPECQPFSPSQMDWDGFSASQKAAFEEAYGLEKESRHTEAIGKYRELSGQIKNFQILYNLGVLEAANGNLADAESELRKSCQMNPMHRETYKLLSHIQKALGREQEARFNMDRYLRL